MPEALRSLGEQPVLDEDPSAGEPDPVHDAINGDMGPLMLVPSTSKILISRTFPKAS